MRFRKRRPTPRHDAEGMSMDTLWQSLDHNFRSMIQIETMRRDARRAQRRIRPATGAERAEVLNSWRKESTR